MVVGSSIEAFEYSPVILIMKYLHYNPERTPTLLGRVSKFTAKLPDKASTPRKNVSEKFIRSFSNTFCHFNHKILVKVSLRSSHTAQAYTKIYDQASQQSIAP